MRAICEAGTYAVRANWVVALVDPCLEWGASFSTRESLPHVHAPPLHTRARIARQGSAAWLDPRLRQPAAGRRAVRRTRAVRQDRRRDVGPAGDRLACDRLALAAARSLGGV